ncbi:hypothetical protein [Gulbenkiania mobilis]|uniref:hypothetical protein n=1 Tax=Gulbenkiania mobilis TaxID=397457 RepID=UPI0013791DEA|nr:hypothetical protein [Gulbenkiania mobilis]
MEKQKTAELCSPSEKCGSNKLAWLKGCLKVVQLLVLLFSAINKALDALSKILQHFS